LTFQNGDPTITGMNLRTVLTEKCIALHLQGTTKEEIIRELLEILVRNGSVSSFEKAYESILDI